MLAPILLTDVQVQAYLTNGYVTLQTAHPPTVHQSIHRQIETLFATEGNPGNDILPKVPDLYQIEFHRALNADTEAERLRTVYALAARGEEAMPVQ